MPEVPTEEEIIIDQFYQLGQELVKQYKRANDLRTVEISLQMLREQAAIEDRSIEFEQLESLMGELVKCGK